MGDVVDPGSVDDAGHGADRRSRPDEHVDRLAQRHADERGAPLEPGIAEDLRGRIRVLLWFDLLALVAAVLAFAATTAARHPTGPWLGALLAVTVLAGCATFTPWDRPAIPRPERPRGARHRAPAPGARAPSG